MRIVHLYDGHEQVFQGRGSVPGVVWNIARETAARGHDVTVMERQWDGLPAEAKHDGVCFERLAVSTGADEPWTRVPYEMFESVSGALRLVGDRTNFALEALCRLRRGDFDVLHVHLPFAANILTTVAPWIRDRLVYTAHLGELRLDLLQGEQNTQQSHTTDNKKGSVRRDGGLVGETTDISTNPGVESASGGHSESVPASPQRTKTDIHDVEPQTDQPEAAGTKPSTPSILSIFSPDIHLAKQAAHTTVLNPDIKAAFINRGVSDASISVVPNGVDIERFATVEQDTQRRVCKQYDLEMDRPILLFVGTIMPRKGVVELIEALDRVVHQYKHSGVQVVIAGETELDGTYRGAVEDRISACRLNETISMPGFVPEEDLPGLYAVADVFAVPSLEEGFGMTAIEALAAGTPVVATRTGDLPRLIGNNECGRLVTPGHVGELANAIEHLLRNERQLERMRTRCRKRAREYSWTAVVNEVEALYAEVDQ